MNAFEKVEAEEMGAVVHEKYHALAHVLTEAQVTGATALFWTLSQGAIAGGNRSC